MWFLVDRDDQAGKGTIEPWVNAPKSSGSIQVGLRELRYAGQSEHQEALERAVRLGHNRVVEQMLSTDPVLDANGSSYRSLLDLAGDAPATRAESIIKILLNHGAQINHHAFASSHGPHWTPFWNAVHDNAMDHAKRLLDHGASFDIPRPHPDQSQGYTVVHLAASCGLMEMVAWLVDHPQCPSFDVQSVKEVFQSRHENVNPNTYKVDWNNGLPLPLLHATACYGVEDKKLAARFVDWLVDTGEDWDALDFNGLVAWEVARRVNSPMAPIFGAKQAVYQAQALSIATPEPISPPRRPRM